ncbi:MAG: Fe-S cluster protein [Deltaproteobacteria bacterium CG2_30_63_29]|nr:MAG: Fe-S cluster protein [Deltaproteobacteria bacterium CG2_30_63_29]
MNEVISTIFIACAVMFGVAGFFGLVLAIADRFLKVVEDERIEVVTGMLPGSNCGACGQPGCNAFANLIIAGGAAPSGCSVASGDVVSEIAGFLGVAAGTADKKVARLHCAGGKSSVRRLAEYSGFGTCRAAFTVSGGGRACPWGCLGLGDCDRICTFDAIHMNDEELPVVDVELCTACGDCVDVCPLDLFKLESLANKVVVQCSSPLKGTAAIDACAVACDACGRCALDAAEGVIEMSGGLPRIKIPGEATRDATFRCPTGAITWVEDEQFKVEEVQRATPRRRHA